jgi:formylmethanofuran dehydrogenase subunit A
LIRLLMDKSFRRDMLATIHQGARKLSNLDGIDREYTLQEIAILTRAGPARILGIHDRHGHLGPGAMADVTVYADHQDRERMFAHPLLLLKAGRPVMRDGEVLEPGLCGGTHVVRPGYDGAIRGRVGRFFEEYRDMRLGTFEVADGEIEDGGRGCVVVHACGAASGIATDSNAAS